MNRIKTVYSGSIAEELEIEIGDILHSINGNPVVDIIDFMYLINDEYIEIEIEKKDGEIWVLEIDKEFDEILGIEFENPIIDQAKRCSNNCVFCFVDQLPKGMRETLYFKDDDSRLSFLQGNFVTLTNLKDADLQRIINYKISPINVSVHTTDPDLRVKMLGNRFAGNIMERLSLLTQNGIIVNAQIVLCPGYNDGDALTKTLMDLMTLSPDLNSIAIVPIGLTKHRDGLIQMEGFVGANAKDVINRVHAFQKIAFGKIKTRLAFLADEFYLQANMPFPSDKEYEGYIQLEDGVGMLRKLMTEVDDWFVHNQPTEVKERWVAIVTGVAAGGHLEMIANRIMTQYEQLHIEVKIIDNNFFGDRITVSGLITGKDIIEQVKIHPMTQNVLLPSAMFRSGEDVLLDDISKVDLESHFNVTVNKVECEGIHLLNYIFYGGPDA